MNILFLSNLPALKDLGPYWSVPNQVASLSKFDNVFWYNIRDIEDEYWQSIAPYNSLKDYPSGKIANLPKPFNKPDLIVIQEIYKYKWRLIHQIYRLGIPYIIVPRGCLTQKAQFQKHTKKTLGNLFLYKRFVSKAIAVQYLTKAEYESSGDKWNNKSFVIPNGVVTYSNKQWIAKKKSNTLRGVSIGRIAIYHKGLDILVEACAKVKDLITENNFIIDFYGPDRSNDREKLIALIKINGLQNNLIVHNHSVFSKEKEQILLNSDFFVMPSRLEGHPMGLIEALSYGLPSLVTRGSNMLDEIKLYDCGWTAEPDVESVANAIIKLIKEKGTIQYKSENALKLAALYNWNNIGKATHDTLKNILQEFRKKRH